MIGSDEQVPALQNVLSDEGTGSKALYALGRFSRSQLLDNVLLKALVETTGRTQIGVINQVAEWQISQAVAPLQKILRKEKDPQLTKASLHALGKIGEQQSWQAIEKISGPWFASTALEIAGELAPAQACTIYRQSAQPEQGVAVRCAELAEGDASPRPPPQERRVAEDEPGYDYSYFERVCI